MPTQHKPKDWNHYNLENYFQVRDLYTDGHLTEAVSTARLNDDQKRKVLEDAVLTAARKLDFGLHYESRPTIPEKKASLDKLNKSLRAILAAFENLDSDTRQLLSAAAGHAWTQHDMPKQWGEFDFGASRLQDVEAAVSNLSKWVNFAKSIVQGTDRRRKGSGSINEAVDDLRDVWIDVVGAKPKLTTQDGHTRGAFLDFVELALGPVMISRGIKMGLEHAVRQSLKNNG